ncbi:hypothetical protein BH23ACT5_BH23ACT5_01060 [soil metagenome]
MPAPTPEEIVELALTHFADADIPVSVTDDGLATEDGRVFGLETLRRRLAGCKASEWAEAVSHHFELLAGIDPSMPETFAEARPNLRAAVVAAADLGWFEGATMERPLVDGLGERLMLRRGMLGMTVSSTVVDGWQVDEREVWAAGRDNALLDEPVEVFPTRMGAVGYLTIRGGRWASSQVLGLDRHIGRHDYGALVSIPARDEVLVHVIVDEAFVEAALAMLTAAASTFAAAPLPVGCDLYWWDDGSLWRICTPGPDGYRYLRVPGFSSALWRLEEATGSGCRRVRRPSA